MGSPQADGGGGAGHGGGGAGHGGASEDGGGGGGGGAGHGSSSEEGGGGGVGGVGHRRQVPRVGPSPQADGGGGAGHGGASEEGGGGGGGGVGHGGSSEEGGGGGVGGVGDRRQVPRVGPSEEGGGGDHHHGEDAVGDQGDDLILDRLIEQHLIEQHLPEGDRILNIEDIELEWPSPAHLPLPAASPPPVPLIGGKPVADGRIGYYNFGTVTRYINDADWRGLESYIVRRVLQSELSIVASKHPQLILYCRRGVLRHFLDSIGLDRALDYYGYAIRPLANFPSECVNSLSISKEIDMMKKEMEGGMITIPSNMLVIIDDYFKLYLPEFSSPSERPKKTTSPLWQFANIECQEKKRTSRTPFRCLACQRLFDNHTISTMKDHLTAGRHIGKCDKVTPSILRRLQEICPNEHIYEPIFDSDVEAVENKPQQEVISDDFVSSLLKKVTEARSRALKALTQLSDTETGRLKLNGELSSVVSILHECVIMGQQRLQYEPQEHNWDIGGTGAGAGGMEYEEPGFGSDIAGNVFQEEGWLHHFAGPLQSHHGFSCQHGSRSGEMCPMCLYAANCSQQDEQPLPSSRSYPASTEAADATGGNNTALAPEISVVTNAVSGQSHHDFLCKHGSRRGEVCSVCLYAAECALQDQQPLPSSRSHPASTDASAATGGNNTALAPGISAVTNAVSGQSHHDFLCKHGSRRGEVCSVCLYAAECALQDQQPLPSSRSYPASTEAADATGGNNTALVPGISVVTNAGCQTDDANQDTDGRKKLRDQPTTFQELKRQRT